jgi:16S rRNA (guanine527-N7)-methyltransferase
MRPGRIDELLQPFLPPESAALSETQLETISIYIDMLLRWNARINLTAVRDPEEIVTRHFGESLFAASHLFPAATRETTTAALADLGSGAGFPGIPIKLWAPHLQVTLIESNQKKSVFLREVTRSLTLTDIDIQTSRAESIAATRPASFDVVTLRAVERFDSILPIAATLVVPGGRLALLIGKAQLSQARAATPTFAWSDAHPIPLSESRILAIAHSGQPQRPVPTQSTRDQDHK